jgi:carboxypeptidase PM20D1
VNVVPSMARATLNIRLLPGNLLEPLLGKLTQLVNDPQVRFEPQTSVGQPAPSSPVDSDFFNEITLTAANEFPGVTVIPMMSTGATDSQQLRLRSVKAYGLLPFPLPEGEVMRMHADDERLPVDSFRKGVLFLDHIIAGFAVSQ